MPILINKYALKCFTRLALVWTCFVYCAAFTTADERYSVDKQQLRAQLTPHNYTVLAAEFGAKINRITVREGQQFVKGQVLVEFDCSLQLSQLERAKVQLAGAENMLKANRALAELNAIGHVELNASEIEVQRAESELLYLNTILSKCVIKAPYDGRAGEQVSRELQVVQPGQAIIEILNDRVLELDFIVPTHWLSWFKPGHLFSVYIEDTNRSYPVALVRTSGRADPVSQSVKAVALIKGSFPELLSGMSGYLLLEPPG